MSFRLVPPPPWTLPLRELARVDVCPVAVTFPFLCPWFLGARAEGPDVFVSSNLRLFGDYIFFFVLAAGGSATPGGKN